MRMGMPSLRDICSVLICVARIYNLGVMRLPTGTYAWNTIHLGMHAGDTHQSGAQRLLAELLVRFGSDKDGGDS